MLSLRCRTAPPSALTRAGPQCSSCAPPRSCRPAAQPDGRWRQHPAVAVVQLVQQQRRAGSHREPGPGQRRLHLPVRLTWPTPCCCQGCHDLFVTRLSLQPRCLVLPPADSPTAAASAAATGSPTPWCRPNGLYNVSGGGSGGGGWRHHPLGLLRGGASAAPRVRLELVQGGQVWEARQTFAEWATLITR